MVILLMVELITMTLNTFQQNKNTSASNIFLYVLAIVGLGLLAYAGFSVFTHFGNIRGKSALTVNTVNSDAEVLLDGKVLGNAPFDSKEIDVGEHKVTIKNADTTYEISLAFEPNAQVVLTRDLGVSPTFSSGQNFWLEESDGSSASIISEPSGAKVFIDNAEVGVTPYASSTLTPGEYDLRVELSDHETQTARIQILDKYKLNVAVTLFPMPAPSTITLLEGSDTLYDVSSSNSNVTSDTTTWVKALNYWNTSRGLNLSGLGVNKEPVFDFYLDYKGNIFDKNGNVVSDVATADFGDAKRGAYLGKLSDGLGLSPDAKEAFAKLGGVAVGGKRAKILETGLGWLRVRDSAGTGGTEITRVDVGNEYAVVDESAGWVKIKVTNDTEGWVSSTYVEIIEE